MKKLAAVSQLCISVPTHYLIFINLKLKCMKEQCLYIFHLAYKGNLHLSVSLFLLLSNATKPSDAPGGPDERHWTGCEH